MKSPILELKRIRHEFQQGENKIDVLKEINLKLYPGESIAMLGPSGSGKTTLLQIAGLVEKPIDGEIILDDDSVLGQSDQALSKLRSQTIGFVYQYHHLLPEFTALENVMIPQMINGRRETQARYRALELLDQVGLSDRVHHIPSQLSGGQQQRVAIARALANEPAVLLADEPTGNLDEETADRVFDMLRRLMDDSKIAMIVATHNLSLAAKLGQILTLKNGILQQ